jgi:type VI secretion system secreted protein Hcp
MKRTRLIFGAVLGLVLAGDASAAFNAYLKIPTIPGESTHGGEGGWTEVGSGQWLSGAPNLDALRPGATATGGPGSVQFVRKAGPSSSLLRRAFDSKQHFPKVQLDVPKPGQEVVYYKIVLTDVFISSFSKGTTSFPTETIKMNWGAIEWTYTEQKPPIRGPAVKQ